jgi:predicted nucleic acid-binding protein
MPDAISNTSPLLYLYRIEALAWLDVLFGAVWIPNAVAYELAEGRRQGYDVPEPDTYHWLRRMEPLALPSEWLALDLGPGARKSGTGRAPR